MADTQELRQVRLMVILGIINEDPVIDEILKHCYRKSD